MTNINCIINSNKKQTNKHYRHLNACKRRQLSAWLKQGVCQAEIARRLNVHRSTISREVKRGMSASKIGVYSWRKANRYKLARRYILNQMHRKLIVGSQLEADIISKIKEYWSPDQIVGREKLMISPKSIYNWFHALPRKDQLELRPYFRHKAKHRTAGAAASSRLYRHRKKRPIDDRPVAANLRLEIGHWEGDTIHGKGGKGRIVTLVDRKSRFLLAAHMPDGTKESFAAACKELLAQIKSEYLRTITLDNGTEMNDFEKIEADSGVTVYFAHPYSSHQRGTNENTNGLIRQIIPKDTKFDENTPKKLAKVVELINNRPRKGLGYDLPAERFQKCLKE